MMRRLYLTINTNSSRTTDAIEIGSHELLSRNLVRVIATTAYMTVKGTKAINGKTYMASVIPSLGMS